MRELTDDLGYTIRYILVTTKAGEQFDASVEEGDSDIEVYVDPRANASICELSYTPKDSEVRRTYIFNSCDVVDFSVQYKIGG